MNMAREWQSWGILGVICAIALATGCQTWTSGATLPSPHYLEHPPQYFPPSPPFPFERELATMEEQLVEPAGAVAPVPLPGAVR